MDALEPSVNTLRLIQAWCLIAMFWVTAMFGGAILAQQWRAGKRPFWPMPGGLVIGGFFTMLALFPLHMALGRFGFLPWTFISWQATIIYGVVALNSIAVVIRWWRVGFRDREDMWDGTTERRSGRDRRKGVHF